MIYQTKNPKADIDYNIHFKDGEIIVKAEIMNSEKKERQDISDSHQNTVKCRC